MWHGYVLIEIDIPLTDDTLDEDGNVVDVGTKNLAINALLQLGTQTGLPHQITHLRASSNGQKIIVEVQSSIAVTKAQACKKLATLLPWTAEQISNNSSFTKSPGDNWEERRQATIAYIKAHKVAWGENNG